MSGTGKQPSWTDFAVGCPQRDNNKLGVVITPQVRPNEVKPLAKSLTQGFHRNFPNQDLNVLMYAPDKNCFDG